MSIQQPNDNDLLNSPNHGLSHRVIANDDAAPVQSITVDSNGVTSLTYAVTLAYVAKTANYTITTSDYQIECTANTFTLTLPTAVSIAGRVYSIKNTGSGAITLEGDGTETIDGELNQTVNQWDNISVMSNGTNWIII